MHSKTIGDVLGSTYARLAAGTAAISAGLYPIPITDNLVFDLQKFLILSAAISAWIWTEIKSIDVHPNEHDIALFKRYVALLSDPIDFARHHDFGNSFWDSAIRNFIVFVDQWNGPTCNFADHKLQRSWLTVSKNVNELQYIISHQCGYLPQSETMLTVKNMEDIRTGQRSQQTLDAAEKLNAKADELACSWDNFVTLGIKVLKIAG